MYFSTPLKWKELCRNNKKVTLGSFTYLFCLPLQRETTDKGVQMRHREPKRKLQVLCFSSELIFSEASSPSILCYVLWGLLPQHKRYCVVLFSVFQIRQVTLRDPVNSNNPDVNWCRWTLFNSSLPAFSDLRRDTWRYDVPVSAARVIFNNILREASLIVVVLLSLVQKVLF